MSELGAREHRAFRAERQAERRYQEHQRHCPICFEAFTRRDKDARCDEAMVLYERWMIAQDDAKRALKSGYVSKMRPLPTEIDRYLVRWRKVERALIDRFSRLSPRAKWGYLQVTQILGRHLNSKELTKFLSVAESKRVPRFRMDRFAKRLVEQ